MTGFETASRKIIGKYGNQLLLIRMEKADRLLHLNKFTTLNSFFMNKHMHKFKWEVRYTKSAIECRIGGEKLAKIIEDVHACKGVEISRDHCFLSIILSFHPRWVNEQNLKRQGNTLEEKLKFRLLKKDTK